MKIPKRENGKMHHLERAAAAATQLRAQCSRLSAAAETLELIASRRGKLAVMIRRSEVNRLIAMAERQPELPQAA